MPLLADQQLLPGTIAATPAGVTPAGARTAGTAQPDTAHKSQRRTTKEIKAVIEKLQVSWRMSGSDAGRLYCMHRDGDSFLPDALPSLHLYSNRPRHGNVGGVWLHLFSSVTKAHWLYSSAAALSHQSVPCDCHAGSRA